MNVNDTSALVNIVYIVLIGGIVLGGIFAVRKGQSKETQDAMERLNDTLDGEIKVLRRRVDDLEKERATQDRVIATIRYALKSQGLRVTIQGDFVTISDSTGKSKSTHIQDRASVKPIVSPDDDDSDVS